jgi:hypothetical protein
MLLRVLLLANLIWSAVALAQDRSVLPTFYGDRVGGLGARGVGFACSTMTLITDALPCNPSLIAKVKTPSFVIQGFASNGYQGFKNAEQLLNGTPSKDYLRSLFGENQTIETEGNAQLVFQARHFGASYTPYGLNYFSRVYNASYPLIDIQAVLERTWNFHLGAEVGNSGLFLGVQTRLIERKFIRKSVALFDLLAQDGSDLIKPQSQQLVLVEPGATYFFPVAWKPRVSLMLNEFGSSNNEYQNLPRSPHVSGGVGIEPPLGWGQLELGLDYKKNRDTSNPLYSVSSGATYRLGAMQALLGVGATELSTGVLIGFKPARVGIVYSSTRIGVASSQEEYVQSVITQFGFEM